MDDGDGSNGAARKEKWGEGERGDGVGEWMVRNRSRKGRLRSESNKNGKGERRSKRIKAFVNLLLMLLNYRKK